jgi:tRNA uridine 5-carboxymethylaminomethyl modification enzyme
MFTSRAEYRLLLREDNADLRLTETGRRLGLVGDEQWRLFTHKRESIERERQRLQGLWVRPNDLAAPGLFREILGDDLRRETRALDLLSRPNVGYDSLMGLPGLGPGAQDSKVTEQLEIQCKYAGYIGRQREEIDRQRAREDESLPASFDYERVRGLSSEVREKLIRVRPATVGQAARIPGVTPAAVSLLLIHLKRLSA